ncbi:hypothetical protein HPB47_025671, partial [Ixodes persulcatus]
QTPADKDHSYHANQETQPGRLNLGKRHSDGDNNSPEASSTPAKLQASQNDDMEQEFTEGDLEAFVLIEHRRQRTTGIPVLLAPVNEERLQKQNPLSLSTEVNQAAAAVILRHRFTNKGGLLVEVAEAATVDRLLKLRSLGGESPMKLRNQQTGLLSHFAQILIVHQE